MPPLTQSSYTIPSQSVTELKQSNHEIAARNNKSHMGLLARASIMTVYTKLNFDASNTPYDSVTQVG